MIKLTQPLLLLLCLSVLGADLQAQTPFAENLHLGVYSFGARAYVRSSSEDPELSHYLQDPARDGGAGLMAEYRLKKYLGFRLGLEYQQSSIGFVPPYIDPIGPAADYSKLTMDERLVNVPLEIALRIPVGPVSFSAAGGAQYSWRNSNGITLYRPTAPNLFFDFPSVVAESAHSFSPRMILGVGTNLDSRLNAEAELTVVWNQQNYSVDDPLSALTRGRERRLGLRIYYRLKAGEEG